MFSQISLRQLFVWGLYAALLTPLLVWQSLIFPFIALKVGILQILVAVLVTLWVVLLVRGEVSRPRASLIFTVLALYIGALFASTLFGVDTLRSFWSTQERGIGIIAILHFGLLALMLRSAREHIDWEHYWLISFGVSVVASIFAFVHLVDPPFFFDPPATTAWGVRPGSFLGNPSYLASYLLPHIFVGAWLMVERVRRSEWVWGEMIGLGVLLNIAVVFLTQTRGALLGFLAGIFVLVGIIAWRGRDARIMGRISVRTLGLCALALVLATPLIFWFTRSAPAWQAVPGLRRLTSLTLQSRDIQPRLIALGISFDAFRERPFLGFGFENFRYAFDARYDPRLLREGYAETYFDRPHNIILEYAVNTGAVGLLAYLGLLGVLTAVMLRRPELQGFAPFGVGLVVAHLGQNVFLFDTFGSYLAFFVLVAFVDSQSDQTTVRDKALRAEWSTRASLVAVGVGLGAAAWVVMNITILYANHKQYWGFNYFANNKPEEGLAAYADALAAPINPYRDMMIKDYVSVLVQVSQQGVIVPDLAQHVKEGMAALREVISRRPSYFLRVSYADAASAFANVDSGFLEQGEEQVRAAIAESPSRQQAYFVLGKLHMLQGNHAGALEAMKKAVEFDPEVGESHFFYGLIALQVGEIELGLSEVDTAKRLGRAPTSFIEMQAVAGQFGDAGRYDEAIPLYEAILKERPGDPETLLKLGLVYFYKGDVQAARQYIEAVARTIDLSRSGAYELLLPILKTLGIDSVRPVVQNP